MIVVSNTSPIINLAAIGQLDLLRLLFGTIAIPQAVFHEVAVRGHEQAGSSEIQVYPWFERHEVQNAALVKQLEQHLDAGEAEAIAVAAELHADLLLIDERRGRRAAQQLGISVVGLLGILLLAKQRGYLNAIKPLLHDLIRVAGFWIDRELYKQVLMSAGEL